VSPDLVASLPKNPGHRVFTLISNTTGTIAAASIRTKWNTLPTI
jgi:hypothetical protein